MGVRGLETFLHNHPECNRPVNLGELAIRYNDPDSSIYEPLKVLELRVASSKKLRENKKNPVLIWDISTCITHMYNKCWVPGGQLKEFAYVLELFVHKLKAAGIELTVFIDGPVVKDKLKNITSQNNQKITNVNKIFNTLWMNQEDERVLQNNQGFYPININKVIIDTLSECDCKVIQATFQCELETAIYAKRNKCFGILAQNSDFVIFNSAEYYFSMKHLDLDTLSTVAYSTEELANALHVEVNRLPLIATLMGGNSFFTPSELYPFHQKLFKECEKYSRNDTFLKVAGFIKTLEPVKNFNSQLPILARTVLGTSKKAYLLKNCLNTYQTIFPHEDFAVQYSLDKKWFEVQKAAVELHRKAKLPPIIFSVIFYSQYVVHIYPEDPNKKGKHSTFGLTRTLRQKLYGIVFNEKPLETRKKQKVKEIFVDSKGETQRELIKPIYPKINVDLVKLWSDTEGDLDEIKWDLFCSSLNIHREILFMEERQLLIPVASLKFLLMNQFDISIWELEATVATMLLLQYYSVRELEAIPEFPMDPHGIHLYWSFIRVFVAIAELNSVCGHPLDSELANPVNYQDGKLFLQKYRQAKDNKSFDNLCEFRQKEIRSGKKIMALILNNKN